MTINTCDECPIFKISGCDCFRKALVKNSFYPFPIPDNCPMRGKIIEWPFVETSTSKG